MKILLLSPLIARTKVDPPVGLCYLQSYLDSKGYTESKIFHTYKSYDEVKSFITEYKPDVVGISCLTVHRGSSFKLAKLAKEINPNIKVVFGGCHSTFMWKQIMENFDFVDYIVIGEGEITFYELVRAIDKKLPTKDIKGIVYKEDGKTIRTEDRPFIENLDDLPFPSWRDVDFNDFAIPDPPMHHFRERKASIVTSRGCVFNCGFCSTTHFWTRRWRARSAKNVVDEIEWLVKEHNVRFFSVSDDIFALDIDRVIDICKGIIERKLDVKWYAETRVDRMSKEMFEWMKKAGCFLVQFGVESGSDKMLNNINKGVTSKQVAYAIKCAKEAGLKTDMLLMVGNIGETDETVDETIKLIDEVKPDVVVVSITQVFPSTRLYEIAKQQNFISDDHWLSDKTAPVYTYENDLKKLLSWRLKIIKSFYNSKQMFGYYKFLIDQIRANPSILPNHLKVFLFNKKSLVEK